MATKLGSLVVRNPGGYGLNFEAETYMNAPTFAETADNMVYDVSGRLSNRKGFSKLHANATIRVAPTLASSPAEPLRTTTSNTKEIIVAESSHGRATGDYVTVSGATTNASSGLTTAHINIRAVITKIDANNWKYYTSGTSTSAASGIVYIFGGSSVVVTSEPSIDSMAVYNYSGSEQLICASTRNQKIYHSVTPYSSTPTDVTGTVSSTAKADGNWQFVNFDNKSYGSNEFDGPIIVKSGTGAFAPLTGGITLGANPIATTNTSVEMVITYNTAELTIGNGQVVTISGAADTNGIAAANINGDRTVKEAPVLNNLAGTGTFKIDAGSSDAASSTGSGGGSSVVATAPGTIPTGGVIHSAFGRLWVQKSYTGTDKNVISYCGILTPSSWGVDTAVGGEIDTLGTFGAIAHGYDELVAISSFDKFLVAFLRNSIIIYSSPDSPNDLGIERIIQGVGCISRDSVQQVGRDLIFLSTNGLQSLRQVIQENADIADLSALVRRQFLTSLGAEANWPNIKSVYNAEDGQYWIKSPNSDLDEVWVFDLHSLDNDIPVRVTKFKGASWDTFTYFQGDVYIGSTGLLGKYDGYVDQSPIDSTKYVCTWRSNPADFGASNLKFLKKFVTTVISGSSDTINVLFESVDTGQSGYETFVITNTAGASRLSGDGGVIALWGASDAEWGEAEWGGGASTYYELNGSCAGAGRAWKLGIDFESNGSSIALEQLAIYAKTGREGR